VASKLAIACPMWNALVTKTQVSSEVGAAASKESAAFLAVLLD